MSRTRQKWGSAKGKQNGKKVGEKKREEIHRWSQVEVEHWKWTGSKRKSMLTRGRLSKDTNKNLFSCTYFSLPPILLNDFILLREEDSSGSIPSMKAIWTKDPHDKVLACGFGWCFFLFVLMLSYATQFHGVNRPIFTNTDWHICLYTCIKAQIKCLCHQTIDEFEEKEYELYAMIFAVIRHE